MIKRELSRRKLESVARVLRTISHPVRLKVLEILETEESLDVGTLCRELGMECEISMMSHHLAKMKDNRILVSEKKGKQVYYSIVDRKLLDLFDCMERCELF